MRYVESLNLALHQLMAESDQVYLIGEDLLDPYGGAFKVSKGLSTAYPNKVITTPISEAGITGFGIGMALRGMRPIVEIMFGDFITLCADQIINHATKFNYMYNGQVNVPLVIRAPMGGRRGYGPTHSQTLEAIFLSVPYLNIIAPSHAHIPGQLLKQAVNKDNNPVLFIENKLLYPEKLIFQDNQKYEGFSCKEITLANADYPTLSISLYPSDKPDVVLIGYGGMLPAMLESAKKAFLEEEILVELLVPSMIKPLPIKDFMNSINLSKKVIIAEEGNITGGWGAELSAQIHEAISSSLLAPVKRLGMKDRVIPSAGNLERLALPGVSDIVKAIFELAGA
ncbi:MAG: hypothetical protein K0Q57_118 [Gammaproteobacteria bacterium]|jgi:pyruvate/2-oxoglutarate/acetoin dehydrogenase E1 component|nr:hypothetical protein [Gammaproteobacteria bacterium]